MYIYKGVSYFLKCKKSLWLGYFIMYWHPLIAYQAFFSQKNFGKNLNPGHLYSENLSFHGFHAVCNNFFNYHQIWIQLTSIFLKLNSHLFRHTNFKNRSTNKDFIVIIYFLQNRWFLRFYAKSDISHICCPILEKPMTIPRKSSSNLFRHAKS